MPTPRAGLETCTAVICQNYTPSEILGGIAVYFLVQLLIFSLVAIIGYKLIKRFRRP